MALTLSHYRFGIAEGTEANHSWLAGVDRPCNRMPGANGEFLLRMCVQADATGLNNVDNEFQFRHSRGGVVLVDWTNITTSSSVVRTGAVSVFTNGQHCTTRLPGTGTFEATGAGCTHDGTSGGTANDIQANGYSETEIGLQIINADTAIGDLIEFRLTRDGGVLLDNYAVTPFVHVAVEILDVQSRVAGTYNSITAGVNKIDNTAIDVEVTGLTDADLADTGLTIIMTVMGTTVVGSTDPADYTVEVNPPSNWTGGQGVGKDGMPYKPAFAFLGQFAEDVRRVMVKFETNKTVSFGAQATIQE
jgi:hypothetical protein